MTIDSKQKGFPLILSKKKMLESVREIINEANGPEELVSEKDINYDKARKVLAELGMNLEHIDVGDDYYIITQMDIGTDWQQMYLRLGNFFGASEHIKVSPFIYTVSADDPDRGASGVGFVMDLDHQTEPLYYGLILREGWWCLPRKSTKK